MRSSHTCETSCIDISKMNHVCISIFSEMKNMARMAKICSNVETNALTQVKQYIFEVPPSMIQCNYN